jgi:MFS superfamily sulfate permease-like transporter
VIDFSSVSTIDASGLRAMKSIYEEMETEKVRVFFACVKAAIRAQFKTFGGYNVAPKSSFFPSVSISRLVRMALNGCV